MKKAVLFEDLAKDAMLYSAAHKRSHRGDLCNLNSLLPVFGKMKADEIAPAEIASYLATRVDLKPATLNRYRSTMAMIFAEGIRNGRSQIIPRAWFDCGERTMLASGFSHTKRKQSSGNASWSVAQCHEAAFTVALETGMRMSEQHFLEWGDVQIGRRQIELSQTKNGSRRIVVLNEKAIKALESCAARRTEKTSRVFLSRFGEPLDSPKAWFKLVMRDVIEDLPALATEWAKKEICWQQV